MKLPEAKRGVWLVVASLCLLTWLTYWRLPQNDFIFFDDLHYLTNNPQVQAGLTGAGFQWAFTTLHASNWHPLTWLSHMLDCQLFGLNPQGHHLMNLAFHTGNALLLFLLIRRLTGSLWRSGFVAAVFALHPMHVESVAWASERKDVLSTFFGLLALLAYVNYARAKTPAPQSSENVPPQSPWLWYALTLAAFAISLLSKPMLVTLPCLLLLLDFWPLQRLSWPWSAMSTAAKWRLLGEKLPFFVLVIGSCFMTMKAQTLGGAVSETAALGIGDRAQNSLVGAAWYVGRFFFPTDQAIIYPLPDNRPFVQVMLALVVLGGITALAVWQMRKRPWLLVGWLWFLGMLVPVIGLVQVGMQAYADRYTYLPYVGLSLMVAWSAAELADLRASVRRAIPFAAAAVLALCVLATQHCVSFWRNHETLFRRALAVTDGNFVAMNQLGYMFLTQGRLDDAVQWSSAAVQAAPKYAEAHDTLGCARLYQGRAAEALTAFEAAVTYQPNSALHWSGAGSALYQLKRYTNAVMAFDRALELRPQMVEALYNRANALASMQRYNEAIAGYQQVLALRPDYVDAELSIAQTLLRMGQKDQARQILARFNQPGQANGRALYLQALLASEELNFPAAETAWRAYLALNSNHVEGRLKLAQALLEQGRIPAAVEGLRALAQRQPELPKVYYWLGVAAERNGQPVVAAENYARALQLQPDQPDVLSQFAELRATSADASVRNGTEAVQLALKACELTRSENAAYLGILGAACAEAGDFTNAIAFAEKARTNASATGQSKIVRRTEEQLTLYQQGKPYRKPEAKLATP